MAGIETLTFYLNSDELIQKISVTKIEVQDDGNNSNEIKSVASYELGSNFDKIKCPTCFQNKQGCLGHTGYIRLSLPYNSPLFIGRIIHFLRIFCHKCGGFVLRDVKGSIKDLAAKISSQVKKGFRCQNIISTINDMPAACGQFHPYIYENKKEGKGNIVIELWESDDAGKNATKKLSRDLLPIEIREIFSRITPESLRKINIVDPYLYPVCYINNNVVVPGNSLRHSMQLSDKKAFKNDFNHAYNSILKDNTKIGDIKGVTNLTSQIGNNKLLQKQMGNLIKAPPETGNSTSWFTLIQHKQGLIRNTVLGSRQFNIMRQFITSNPMARLDEIVIPQTMAARITRRVMVNRFNIDTLKPYLINGIEGIYPGIIAIYKSKNKSYHLTAKIKNLSLSFGDEVYIQIITGDISAFCRQPTLMLSNIMGTKLIVDSESTTFNFNPNILPLVGGDFDGDEMNKYLGDKPEDSYEISKCANINQLLISNGYGSPIVGQCQDGMIGLSLLTRDNIELTYNNAAALFYNTGLVPSFDQFISEKKKLITGRDVLTELFSLLNIKITYNAKATYYKQNLNPFREYSKTEINVVINSGKFISGIIDKKAVGEKAYGNLYHIIYHKYGAQITSDTIWYMQRIAINYLSLTGITIHIEDFLIAEEEIEKINNIEAGILEKSKALTKTLHDGKLAIPTGKSIKEYYEEQQINILKGMDIYNSNIHNGIDYNNNNLYTFVHTGTKGSPMNLINTTVSCGLALFKGNIIHHQLDGRASFCFHKNSIDPRSLGFIQNSYYKGYTPVDIINSSWPHRENQIDKALSTALSGTKYREGISSLDAIILTHIHSVMKGSKLRQLMYGDDGMDPRTTFRTSINFINFSDKEINSKLSIKLDPKLRSEELKILIEGRDLLIQILINYQTRSEDRGTSIFYIPINFPIILSDTTSSTTSFAGSKGSKGGNATTSTTSTTSEAGSINSINSKYQIISKFINEIHKLYYNSYYEGEFPFYLVESCKIFKYYLKYELRSEVLENLSIVQINTIIYLIKENFIKNLENAGCCVGIRAIQAIAEPNTQQMLSAIHGKGVNKTSLFQMVMAAVPLEKMKDPKMEIYLKNPTKENTTNFALEIEVLKFKYFINKIQIFYESYGKITHPIYESENEFIKKRSKIIQPPNDLINWCVRIELDLNKIITKNITIEEINSKLIQKYDFIFTVIETANSEKPIMRLYFRQSINKYFSINNSLNIKNMMLSIIEINIKGIEGIISTYIKSRTISTTNTTNTTSEAGSNAGSNSISEENIYYIITDGINLSEILLRSEVDGYLTTCNCVKEMEKFYGIATARNHIIDQLKISVEGVYPSHYTIIADEVCSTGVVTGLNRIGSGHRDPNNICTLIADSAPLQHLQKAAINGITDKNIGPNSAMIMGSVPKCGTNYNRISYNQEFIIEEQKKAEKILEDL